MVNTPLVIAPKVTVTNFGQIIDPTNSNFYKITKQGGVSTMTFFPVGFTIQRPVPSYIQNKKDNNEVDADEDDKPLVVAKPIVARKSSQPLVEVMATATIEDAGGVPLFKITVEDDVQNPITASSPALAWQTLYSKIPGKVTSVNGLSKYALQDPLVSAAVRQLNGAKQAWELALPSVPFPSTTTTAAPAPTITKTRTASATSKKQTAVGTDAAPAQQEQPKAKKPRAKKADNTNNNQEDAAAGQDESNNQKPEPRRRTRSTRDKEQKEAENEVGAAATGTNEEEDDDDKPLVPLLMMSGSTTKPKTQKEPKATKPAPKEPKEKKPKKVTKAQATGFQTSLDAWFQQKKNHQGGDDDDENENDHQQQEEQEEEKDLLELFKQAPELARQIIDGGGSAGQAIDLDKIFGAGNKNSNKNANASGSTTKQKLDPHEVNQLDRPLLDRYRSGKAREVFFNTWEKSFFTKQQQMTKNGNVKKNSTQNQNQNQMMMMMPSNGNNNNEEDEKVPPRSEEKPALQDVHVPNALFKTPDNTTGSSSTQQQQQQPVDVDAAPPTSTDEQNQNQKNDNNKAPQEESKDPKQVALLKKQIEKLAASGTQQQQHQSRETILSQQRSRFLRAMWDYTSERKKIKLLLENVANHPKMSEEEKAKYLNPMIGSSSNTASATTSGVLKSATTVTAKTRNPTGKATNNQNQQKQQGNEENNNNQNQMMMMMPNNNNKSSSSASPKRTAITISDEK